jgi:aspartate kinase
MITTSDIKISVLIDRATSPVALQATHHEFGLDKAPATTASIGQPVGQKRRSLDELETDVVARLANMEDIVVSEIELDSEQSRVTLRQIPDSPGVAAQVFGANAQAGVMVDMIVQDQSHGGAATLSFTVPRNSLETSLQVTGELAAKWPGVQMSSEREIAKLSVTGIGLRTHTGVGERMFKALADVGINVDMISTSEIRISVVIRPDRGREAHACLTQAFEIVE